MTISYTSEVPNGSAFGCFWRILIKWRGSVYKLIWRELLVYLFAYYVLNFTYRYALDTEQQKLFEKIRYYFGNSSESIPMSFVLGFYVSLVVKRWWEQYKLLPWPDNLALFISAAIPGNDERGRLMRRNIVRYAVLAYVITLQRISLRVKRRFPSLQHIVDVGLMMESEKKIFEMMDKKAAMSKYWMPLVWATNIINRARKEQLITSDHVVQTLLVELSDIRKKLGGLIGYDTVCVPLVYTQVVTLSLYAYFFSALLGRQFISQSEPTAGGKYEDPDMYFPFFTTLQFCFYVGWLKVAEVLINPFGEDDDDIELNWLIDRHIKAGYMIVDEMHEEHPELLKDQYWDEVVPKDLPYTVASEHYRREEPKGSAEHYKVKQSDALYANVFLSSHVQSHGGPGGHGGSHGPGHRGPKGLHMQDDVYADYESVDTPLVERRKNWLQRQITRMGSVRSSSTTYSSGGAGFFSRNRHNSVYSSPENGMGLPNGANGGVIVAGLPGQQQHSSKTSFYDRFRRKSIQSRQARRDSAGTLPRLSSVPVSLKNRPRIPTPDVSKEISEREQRLALSASNAASIGAAVVGMLPPPPSYQQTTAPTTTTTTTMGNPTSGSGFATAADLAHPDAPAVLQVVVSGSSPGLVLSPIQEKTELQGAAMGSPVAVAAAAHLAQAVLPQGLKPGTGFSPGGATTTTTTVALPVTMSQLSRLLPGITTTAAPLLANGHVQLCVSPVVATTHPAYQHQHQQQQLATLTELASASSTGSDEEPQNNHLSSSTQQTSTNDSYRGRSPILVDPGKLDLMASLPHVDFKQPNYALQAREHRAARSEAAAKGRRSTSLPGPSLLQHQQDHLEQQARDDRSMSLPLSLSKSQGPLPPLKPRAVSVSGPPPDAHTASTLEQALLHEQQQQPRPRSGSLERAPPPPIRKISSPLLPSASKRGEVYV